MAPNPDANIGAPSATPAAAATTSGPKDVVNDPARTGFDPQTKWWMNYFRILSGQMTPEGQFHYREWRYKVHEDRDCKRCEDYRNWLFSYSPVVRFLQGKIGDLNGRLDASNVVCRRCPARLQDDGHVHRQSGGFSPNHGILLCANEIRDRKHLEDTLAHEMVHAWDHLRWNVDWTGDKDLKHAACTEVRISNMRYVHSYGRLSLSLSPLIFHQRHIPCKLHKHATEPIFPVFSHTHPITLVHHFLLCIFPHTDVPNAPSCPSPMQLTHTTPPPPPP